MRRAKVKVDVDNCLNDLVFEQFKLYEERTGIKLNYAECVNYDFSGIGPQNVIDDLYDMFKDKELWDRLAPPANAQKYLKKLCEEFDVRITTATDYRNFAWKVDWLQKYYPFVPEENIIRIHDKGWIYTDYSVDDYQENLKQDLGHRILISAPWNQQATRRDNIFSFYRVADMKEAYETICRIEELEGSAE